MKLYILFLLVLMMAISLLSIGCNDSQDFKLIKDDIYMIQGDVFYKTSVITSGDKEIIKYDNDAVEIFALNSKKKALDGLFIIPVYKNFLGSVETTPKVLLSHAIDIPSWEKVSAEFYIDKNSVYHRSSSSSGSELYKLKFKSVDFCFIEGHHHIKVIDLVKTKGFDSASSP